MADPEGQFTTPIRAGRREFRSSSDGRDWCRRLDDGVWGPWKEYHAPTPPAEEDASLSSLWLVRQRQAGGPLHWSLVIAPGGTYGVGDVYQVKGDTLKMQYVHVKGADIFVCQSYVDSFRLGGLDARGKEVVEACAGVQPPPAAASPAEITENCQGWALRVVTDLEARGVVAAGTADAHRGLMEAF
ncbi:hypothetical protein F4861DRAFT_190576 [Xylaria intraflava]|nr:hypothetical protein F4861DRAFT_190576 [Xylaria intraflava]